jgi:hypothetical protein
MSSPSSKKSKKKQRSTVASSSKKPTSNHEVELDIDIASSKQQDTDKENTTTSSTSFEPEFGPFRVVRLKKKTNKQKAAAHASAELSDLTANLDENALSRRLNQLTGDLNGKLLKLQSVFEEKVAVLSQAQHIGKQVNDLQKMDQLNAVLGTLSQTADGVKEFASGPAMDTASVSSNASLPSDASPPPDALPPSTTITPSTIHNMKVDQTQFTYMDHITTNDREQAVLFRNSYLIDYINENDASSTPIALCLLPLMNQFGVTWYNHLDRKLYGMLFHSVSLAYDLFTIPVIRKYRGQVYSCFLNMDYRGGLTMDTDIGSYLSFLEHSTNLRQLADLLFKPTELPKTNTQLTFEHALSVTILSNTFVTHVTTTKLKPDQKNNDNDIIASVIKQSISRCRIPEQKTPLTSVKKSHPHSNSNSNSNASSSSIPPQLTAEEFKIMQWKELTPIQLSNKKSGFVENVLNATLFTKDRTLTEKKRLIPIVQSLYDKGYLPELVIDL